MSDFGATSFRFNVWFKYMYSLSPHSENIM